MIIVYSKNIVKLDKFSEMLPLVEKLVAESRKEDGCIEYFFTKADGAENEYAFIEKWESKEALELHRKTPHFIELVPKITEFRESSALTIYEIVL